MSSPPFDWRDELSSSSATDCPESQVPSNVRYIPTGLPAHQRLTMPGYASHGEVPWNAWTGNMFRLFRANGVFDIMHDAIDTSAAITRQGRLRADETNMILTGAQAAITAQLNVTDKSQDMTLLLQADDIINASIDDQLAVWLAGVNNPHEKWSILKDLLQEEPPHA